MWIDYNSAFELNAEIVPMSMLRLDDEDDMLTVLDHPKYEDREFVLIDESHNFRHHGSQRYSILQSFLAKAGRKVCLLTATPRNSSAIDVYNQIKLFHLDDVTDFPISPANLKDYFREIEAGKKKLQDLLVHVLIRRTRRQHFGANMDLQKIQTNQCEHFRIPRLSIISKVKGLMLWLQVERISSRRDSLLPLDTV